MPDRSPIQGDLRRLLLELSTAASRTHYLTIERLIEGLLDGHFEQGLDRIVAELVELSEASTEVILACERFRPLARERDARFRAGWGERVRRLDGKRGREAA